MSASETELRAAYAECRRLASRHYENFPTASYLVPRDKRDALAAVYAFARYADDVADEPGVENRLEKLADWRAKLGPATKGKSITRFSWRSATVRSDSAFRARTLKTCCPHLSRTWW